jgi:hypothetical protein
MRIRDVQNIYGTVTGCSTLPTHNKGTYYFVVNMLIITHVLDHHSS